MGIRWNRFAAMAAALVGALWFTPVMAASGKPSGHATRPHVGAKGTSKHAAVAAKGPRVKPHAVAVTPRKASKPHAVATGSRPVNRATVRAQRKPVSAQHGALRHATGKKPVRAGAMGHAAKPGAKPGSKTHGAAVGKRTAHKTAARRSVHKKTAH